MKRDNNKYEDIVNNSNSSSQLSCPIFGDFTNTENYRYFVVQQEVLPRVLSLVTAIPQKGPQRCIKKHYQRQTILFRIIFISYNVLGGDIVVIGS